jgi:hypothetical protein
VRGNDWLRSPQADTCEEVWGGCAKAAPSAPSGAQEHSRAMAHPFWFFSSCSPLSVCRYCFDDFKSNLSILYVRFCNTTALMDPIDFLATNAQSYWTRFDDTTKCFETDSSLKSPVHIVDIPASAKPEPSGAVPLKVHECNSLKSLDDCLSDPANASYSFRFL